MSNFMAHINYLLCSTKAALHCFDIGVCNERQVKLGGDW